MSPECFCGAWSMKWIKHLIVIAGTLLSLSSIASLQPAKQVSSDAPIRIMAGVNTGVIHEESKLGLSNMSAGLSFAHNVGYHIEYGLGLKAGWASPEFRIFTENAKEFSGMHIDIELMIRFMPEVLANLHCGGLMNLAWGRQFGEFTKPYLEAIAFGDLAFKAGLALSYDFTSMLSMYLAPSYALTGIRFLSDKEGHEIIKEQIKDRTNWHGVEVPVGLWVAFTPTVALYVDANTKVGNFKKAKKSLKEDLTLGVSFAI
jgi:hypothetical protein